MEAKIYGDLLHHIKNFKLFNWMGMVVPGYTLASNIIGVYNILTKNKILLAVKSYYQLVKYKIKQKLQINNNTLYILINLSKIIINKYYPINIINKFIYIFLNISRKYLRNINNIYL